MLIVQRLQIILPLFFLIIIRKQYIYIYIYSLTIQEISVGEAPSLVTLVDSALAPSAGGAGDNHICVGEEQQELTCRLKLN